MRRPALRQRGVAVVTALLLTTLAVSIVASLFWQQQVQVRSMENQRLHLQTRWILRGGLDLVRLVLQQDRLINRTVTRADDIWATPLAETRLDQFIERERVQNESFDATIAGQTYDAQSRYNLAGLAGNRAPVPAQVAAFQRLLQNLNLDPALALPVAEQVARSQAVSGSSGGGAPMPLLRVEDLLAVAGFTPAAVEKLRDFVVVLPPTITLNVNTASAEVLSAITDMSLSEAKSMVLARKRAFFDPVEFSSQLRNNGRQLGVDQRSIGVFSDYFLVLSRVRLDRAQLVSWSLLKREERGKVSVIWIREI